MNPQTSFTSPSRATSDQRWQNVLQIVGWAIAGLITLDIGVNWLSRYPQDVNTEPNTVQRYFDYGHSTEGKLRRMFGPTSDSSAPLAKAGWLEPEKFAKEPSQRAADDNLMIAIYGMSFSRRVGDMILENHPDVAVRNIRAPAAAPNWVHAAFNLDLPAHEAEVAVFTVMSSSIPSLNSLTGSTRTADVPYPYTQPQYYLQDDQLKAIWPSLVTEADYRQAIRKNGPAWQAFEEELATHDPFYSDLSFQESLLDASPLSRVLKRAYVQMVREHLSRRVYDPATGFKPESQEIKVLRALVKDFAHQAREQGIVPIVYLVNNRDNQDHLDQVLVAFLEAEEILYVSSMDFAPTDDPRKFIPDGHFIPEADAAIAAEIVRVARQNLAQ